MNGGKQDHKPEIVDVPGHELEVLPTDIPFAQTVDAMERQSRTVDIHEASGVRLEFNTDIDSDSVNRVFMHDTTGNADDGCLTQPYLYLPADELHTARVVRLYEEGQLDHL